MLCQQCQVKAATVFFSTVGWPSGEETSHLCEPCFAEVQEERSAAYRLKQKPLPVIDVERITASEYLKFAERAHTNSEDAPTYRYIDAELKKFPAARERIGIEILTMALQSLEDGKHASGRVGLGSCLVNSVPGSKGPVFLDLLDKIIVRSVELMARSARAPSQFPFGLDLTIAGIALRRADPQRFSTLLESLRTQHQQSRPGRAVLDFLDKRMAELEQRQRKKGGRDRD